MTVTKRMAGVLGAGLLVLAVGIFMGTLTPPADAANPCAANPCAKNPCAANPCAKNPCAKNPCAAANPCNPCGGNPCAAKNPCGAANPCNPCGGNPCGASNPCGGNPCNPCGGGSRAKASDFLTPKGVRVARSTPKLVAKGEALWNDKSLSGNGLACATCHVGGSQLNATFAKAYPHKVAMPHQQAGVAKVNAAEMVQFCMLTPMAADALEWDSVELAALTAYVGDLQKTFKPRAGAQANPCNPCGNPCGGGNPCAANPCNPCAANPCNPCGR